MFDGLRFKMEVLADDLEAFRKSKTPDNLCTLTRQLYHVSRYVLNETPDRLTKGQLEGQLEEVSAEHQSGIHF